MQMQIIIEKFLRSAKSHELHLTANQRIVLFILSTYMGKKKKCWPSLESLILDCGIPKRTLIRVIQSLEKLELLIIIRSINKNNIYEFDNLVVPPWHPTVPPRHSTVPPWHSNNINNNINNNAHPIKYFDEQKENTKSSEPSGLLKEFIKKKVK